MPRVPVCISVQECVLEQSKAKAKQAGLSFSRYTENLLVAQLPPPREYGQLEAGHARDREQKAYIARSRRTTQAPPPPTDDINW